MSDTDRTQDRQVAMALGWRELTWGEHRGGWIGVSPYTGHRERAPSYSAAIGWAWECVTYLGGRYGFKGRNGFLLTRKDEEGKPGTWYCELQAEQVWECAEAPTAPEAICKLFLAVVAALPDLGGAGPQGTGAR